MDPNFVKESKKHIQSLIPQQNIKISRNKMLKRPFVDITGRLAEKFAGG